MSQLTDQMIRRAGSEPLKSASVTEDISVVIPTYRREQVLLDTLRHLMALSPVPNEILVIDQTPNHEAKTEAALQSLNGNGLIRWIRLEKPSITRAMNIGLQQARCQVVLFLDDDIIPHSQLMAAHLKAQQGNMLVAGQVLQPGDVALLQEDQSKPFTFNSTHKQLIAEFIGCNFSVNREFALSLGGFDENFVHVAYRYEAEFADRALTCGERVLFEPAASVRHLKAVAGGTRSYGHHLTTIRPSHAVGAYYFMLRARNVSLRGMNLLSRPFRAVRTKHHLRHPWWIPATFVSELMGFVWALALCLRGPRLLKTNLKAVGFNGYD